MTHHMHAPAAELAYLTAQTRIPATSLLAVRIAVVVSKWATRRRTRQTLRTLSEAQLRDVGLTRAAALTEAGRVFWRA